MINMHEILKLSVTERILLIEKIWESINTDETSIHGAQERELDIRLARYEKGETTFYRWDEIKNELNALN